MTDRRSGSNAPEARRSDEGLPELYSDNLTQQHLETDKCFACLKTPFSLPVPGICVWTMRDVLEAGVWVGWRHLTPSSLPTHRHSDPCRPGPLSCFLETRVCVWGEGVAGVWVDHSSLNLCVTISEGFFFFSWQFPYLSCLLNPNLLQPKCHGCYCSTGEEQQFQRWGIYFYSTAGLPKVT